MKRRKTNSFWVTLQLLRNEEMNVFIVNIRSVHIYIATLLGVVVNVFGVANSHSDLRFTLKLE